LIRPRILLDTGDRSALTVVTRFLAEPGIAPVFAGAPVQVTGVGIGGAIPARLGHVAALELGADAGVVLHNVIARNPVIAGGLNALTSVDASVGNEVLRQFTVVFDYGAQVVYLRPGRDFDAPTRFTPVPHPPE
jgi:hypothetical protein